MWEQLPKKAQGEGQEAPIWLYYIQCHSQNLQSAVPLMTNRWWKESFIYCMYLWTIQGHIFCIFFFFTFVQASGKCFLTMRSEAQYGPYKNLLVVRSLLEVDPIILPYCINLYQSEYISTNTFIFSSHY